MSPEDIFASQMWPWPDPALKRDSMGRVLFVNAAFLQMYGGTIDDWRGNIVTGWPAPQAPGMPYRFETRLPSETSGEQVFDWMEFTLADGNAFAMARNVTYLFQPIDPNPGTEAEPAMLATQQAETVQDNAAAMPSGQPAVAETAVQEPIFQEQQPVDMRAESHDPIVQAAQSIEIPEVHTTQNVEIPEFEQELAQINQRPETQLPETQALEIQTPNIQASDVQSKAMDSVASGVAGVGVVGAGAAVAGAIGTQTAEAFEDTRAYERRALPIENDDAVLGNNWRDAVIAKAVGAETPAEKVSEEQPTASENTDGPGPIRILLAEDNAINALLTRTLLEAEGHNVDTVEDGALAVEAMKTSSYDLIFMDMRMPNMDGLEATRKIRAMDNVPKGLPIIALTANAFDDDRNACFDSGMNDFMTKPVSAEELSEMVRTWTKNLAERNVA